MEGPPYLKPGLYNTIGPPSLSLQPLLLLMVWLQEPKMRFEQRDPRDRICLGLTQTLVYKRDTEVCRPGQSCGSPISLMSSCGFNLAEDIWGQNRCYMNIKCFIPPVYIACCEDQVTLLPHIYRLFHDNQAYLGSCLSSHLFSVHINFALSMFNMSHKLLTQLSVFNRFKQCYPISFSVTELNIPKYQSKCIFTHYTHTHTHHKVTNNTSGFTQQNRSSSQLRDQ